MRKVLNFFGTVCGYSAAALNAAAFVWYCLGIWQGTVATNPISWWLWALETATGLAIFISMTKQDPAKWLNEAVSLCFVLPIGAYFLWEVNAGRQEAMLSSIDQSDWIATGLAVAVYVFWRGSRRGLGDEVSGWLFQIPLLIAVYPLARAAYADPSAEPFWPWAIWTVSFGLQSLCVTLKWGGVTPLLSPLNYCLTHGLIAFIVWQGAAS